MQPEERISSFVFKQEHIVKKTATIRWNRLMPRRTSTKTRGRLELSVCRSAFASEQGIWHICADFFDPYAPNAAIGRCDAVARVVYDEGLGFDPDGVPYPEHANIIGWHDERGVPYENLKHYWIDQAQRMAPHFSFVARPK